MWLVVWSVLACGGWSGDDDTPDEAPERVTAVRVEAVGEGEVADVLTTTAVVEAERSADIPRSDHGDGVGVSRCMG